MDNEQIKKESRIIGNFMGRIYHPKLETTTYINVWDYKNNWNELMPVVEKICDYNYPDVHDFAAFMRTFGMKDDNGNYMVRVNGMPLHSAKTLLEATYSAVLEFIVSLEELNKP